MWLTRSNYTLTQYFRVSSHFYLPYFIFTNFSICPSILWIRLLFKYIFMPPIWLEMAILSTVWRWKKQVKRIEIQEWNQILGARDWEEARHSKVKEEWVMVLGILIWANTFIIGNYWRLFRMTFTMINERTVICCRLNWAVIWNAVHAIDQLEMTAVNFRWSMK
jgi:hypothetical protein